VKGTWAALALALSLAGAPSHAESVRVKLTTLNFPLTISGNGISIRGIRNSDIQSVAIPKTSELKIETHKVVGKNLWLVHKGETLNRLSQKYLEITSSDDQIKISGYKVSTPVLITNHGDIIASMPLNTYLEGVLAGEMPTNWPIEALKSQAVAARSYTLYQINQRKNNIFQLEGSILDQVYANTENSDQRTIIRQALAETDGIVLMDHGRVMKAYYHSDCGGKTEDPEKVWGGTKTKGLPTVVTDAHCAFNPGSKWTFDISLDEMRKKIESPFKDVRIVTKTASGRAALIAFNEADDKNVLISGNELRKILGYNKLKSTLFSVSIQDDTVTFTGRGFGHGSGLCQWGARYMAQKGASVREILKHYYPNANITEVSHVADL
jgi:stage II sporulation protein D